MPEVTLDVYTENAALMRRLGKIFTREQIYREAMERNGWRDKVWEIIKADSFEELPRPEDYIGDIYLFHPLPGRKMYHILTVSYRGNNIEISCSCQGMMKNHICSHAIALRVVLGFQSGYVKYKYIAPGSIERDILAEYTPEVEP